MAINSQKLIQRARALSSELSGVLDQLTEEIPVRFSGAARKCAICLKTGHRSDTCPDKPIDVKPDSKALSELEFADVLEKFEELGTSKKVAEDMNLPIAEVNQAINHKDFKTYLQQRREHF